MINFQRLVSVISPVVCLLVATPAQTSNTPWLGEPAKADIVNLQLPETIRVSILRSRHPISIACTGKYSYKNIKSGKVIELGPSSVLKIRGVSGGMMVGTKKHTSTLQVVPVAGDAVLMVNKRAYRGSFFIRPRGNGVVDVIEQVNFEEYLNGVLPREVGADWPEESLKAQAVISRTYVVANLGKSAEGYDVTSDVYSQVYGGLQSEQPAPTAAVQATRGEILIDDKGAPVMTFFHSSCGGRTENPRYVWQDLPEPPPYLNSVKDSFCKGEPYSNWELNMNADVLRKKLRKAGYKRGAIKKISAEKTSPSGRVWVFRVEPAGGGRVLIPGNSFRLAVGPERLRSTLVTEIKKRKNSFHFEGKGWGHGVGLCQWGARGRALDGQSYNRIIEAYYPGSRLLKTHGEEAAKQEVDVP